MRAFRPYLPTTILTLWLGVATICAEPIPPNAGLSFARVDIGFSGTPNPDYGIVTVDIPAIAGILGSSSGYVNVVDASGNWIVQNVPVADGYGYAGISTMVDFTGVSGSSIDVYAEVTVEPLDSNSPPAGPLSPFSIAPLNVPYDAQGKGATSAAQPDAGNVPNPNLVTFALPDPLNTFGTWQAGHSSVEQDDKQCGPASVANSLEWLRSTYGNAAPLNPGLLNIPGIAGVPANSLVGQVDNAMGRAAGQTVSDGAFMKGIDGTKGKLGFIDDAANGLKGKLIIKHWPGADPATNGKQTVGTTTSTDVSGGGATIVDWIISEVAAGEDVEMSWLWDGGGGHWVDLIGAGKIGGVPWVAWVHDGKQGDNTMGTNWSEGGVGFSTITAATRLLPTWVGSRDAKATLDLTVSESTQRCSQKGNSGKYCTADVYPNNGDDVWDYADDGDCIISLSDLAELLGNYWCTNCTHEDGDVWPENGDGVWSDGVDGDGLVNINDLAELLSQYGDDCTDQFTVSIPADLPFGDLGQTTCGRVDDYGDTCLGYYDGGEDLIYQLNVTATTEIQLTMDPNGTSWTGLALATDCPPVTCIDTDTGSSGVRNIVATLDPGTYYVMVDTWPSPNCIPYFDLTITVYTSPTGACCYDDPIQCVTNTQPECDALAGIWYEGEDCDTFACP
jgi:hypothetical protein